MKRTLFLVAVCALCTCAFAQQGDFAFGVGGMISPSAPSAINTLVNGGIPQEKFGGGAFPAFSADFVFKHNLGVQGEVSWRAKQALYAGFQPYRPILYDINGIWAPNLGKRVGFEALAGFGAESIRFYTGQYTCSFTSCTNYTSSNHLMADVGAGLKLYVTDHIFVRPEFRQYFVRNNNEFTSANATRVGISIGYTIRSEAP